LIVTLHDKNAAIIIRHNLGLMQFQKISIPTPSKVIRNSEGRGSEKKKFLRKV